MEKATAWQEERAPGRQHQQRQGRRVHTVPCLALGMGKGCPSPRHVSAYPEVEGRKAGSTGANRLDCPSTPVGTEPRGHGSGCSLIPRELVLLTDQREWGCPRGLSLPAARPAALGRGEDRLRPFRGQIQGTSTSLQSMKVNQLCPALAFYLSPGA